MLILATVVKIKKRRGQVVSSLFWFQHKSKQLNSVVGFSSSSELTFIQIKNFAEPFVESIPQFFLLLVTKYACPVNDLHEIVQIQMPQIWQMLGMLHVWRMELNLDSMNSFFGSPYPHPYFKASVISLWELQLAESRTSKDRPWLNWTTVVFAHRFIW